jgi:hypothetical protein
MRYGLGEGGGGGAANGNDFHHSVEAAASVQLLYPYKALLSWIDV